MSRTTIRWSDAPFNWPSEPALDEKALNSPQPCSHGSNCRYNGPCAFVHKGEEGTGRRLFPQRTLENGDTQAACVRLIGSPGFYERRRLRLSWPDWCAKKGIQNSGGQEVTRQVTPKPTTAGRMSFAAVAASSAPPMPPMSHTMLAQMNSFFLQQQLLAHQSLLSSQMKEEAQKAARRNEYGQKIFDKLLPYVSEMKALMCDNWPKAATAAKLTGMFLETDDVEWEKLLNNESFFEEQVKCAIDVLGEHTS